jgi:hypothetical protein
VAVTDFAASIVTWQVPVPVHAPLQPEKIDPDAGVAVSVTEAPELKFAEHAEPQSIPAGDETTAPEPAPAFVTERAKVPGAAVVKVAVTDFAAPIVTWHAPLPVHAPDQWLKVAEGLPGAEGVSVTT